MNLETLLDVLGVDTRASYNLKNEVNLYTQFGKWPTANLIFKDDKFILRFGDAVEPSSMCEELETGVIRVTPLKPKLEHYND